MNKVFLIVSIVAGSLLLSCSNNNSDQNMSTEVVKNTKSADRDLKPYEAPKMTFEESTYDFGRIIQGEKIAFSYHFENTGKNALVINNVRTSCGCTVGTFPRESIKPGEKGKIEIVFDSKGKKGFQNKTATVVANTQPNNTVLYIKGVVVVPEKN